MGNSSASLILQEKPALTLLAINRGGTYASVISREIESTFAHTTNILNKLEEQGLVIFEPDGSDNRVKRVELTDRGQDAAVLVEELAAVLDGKKPKDGNRKKIPRTKDLAIKIGTIQAQIEQISHEELEGKDHVSQQDYVRIGRRLGPYRRELRKIMEIGEKKDVEKAQDLDELINRIFSVRESLRST